ncbi:hypothetical protein CNECB9_4370014 [Cupriavidus necator]|uniref:Uncharacterized protein n=1 Tax=Cupriavidus necator TaxID=106590 RepID=A0A1K0IKY1_CUPNE|nr:hypothetical protein CNECB9_4370014 [Cupriavidus necator]
MSYWHGGSTCGEARQASSKGRPYSSGRRLLLARLVQIATASEYEIRLVEQLVVLVPPGHRLKCRQQMIRQTVLLFLASPSENSEYVVKKRLSNFAHRFRLRQQSPIRWARRA